MKQTPPEGAARELLQLNEQAELARSRLSELQHQVDAAQHLLGSTQSVQLREANELLVLALMRAQSQAETDARSIQELSRSAKLDALTALPNRAVLLERLARAISDSKSAHTRLAVLFVDLNNFKQINDTLGYAIGDEVLQLAARRLLSVVGVGDTVGRYGSDEFLILLADISQASDAVAVAEKVRAALGAPSRVEDHVLRLSASIGVSLYPQDAEHAHTLINLADAAMRRTRKAGLGSFLFHGEQVPVQRKLAAPQLASLQAPLTHYELALAEHVRRNAQLREANELLVLAALNAQELQSAAEQAHRQQNEFLAVLAHELRSPLTPIRTAAALLVKVRVDELPQMQAIIERQVVHLSRLVGDLLDVSRVNTGKLQLELQVVELASVVGHVIAACRPAIDTRMQHFGVHLPMRALEVHGDPVRLTQVFCNLLDNASKYTPNSGDISFSAAIVGADIELTIADSGIGIPAATLPKVFDPFMQDKNAVGFNRDGLGLGLTVVRELVEAHGGTVTASSAGSGLGSQFVVSLPLARSE